MCRGLSRISDKGWINVVLETDLIETIYLVKEVDI